jgi:hypothetical protein
MEAYLTWCDTLLVEGGSQLKQPNRIGKWIMGLMLFLIDVLLYVGHSINQDITETAKDFKVQMTTLRKLPFGVTVGNLTLEGTLCYWGQKLLCWNVNLATVFDPLEHREGSGIAAKVSALGILTGITLIYRKPEPNPFAGLLNDIRVMAAEDILKAEAEAGSDEPAPVNIAVKRAMRKGTRV